MALLSAGRISASGGQPGAELIRQGAPQALLSMLQPAPQTKTKVILKSSVAVQSTLDAGWWTEQFILCRVGNRLDQARQGSGKVYTSVPCEA